MTRVTRGFAAAAIVALVAVSFLHLGALTGVTGTWAAMVALTFFGWATGMIFAVSYHVMPVFLARDFPESAPMRGHLVLFGAAAILLPVVLVTSAPSAFIAFAYALHGLSGVFFIYNLILLIRDGPPRALGVPPTPFPEQRTVDKAAIQATRMAPFALAGAPVLIAASYARWLPGSWHLAAEHWFVLGWLLPMVMGVAYHILPRFSQVPVRSGRLARNQLALLAASVPMVVLGLGLPVTWLFTVGAAAGGASVLLFVWNVQPAITIYRAKPTTIAPMKELSL